MSIRKLAGGLFSIVLYLLALASSTEGFFHKKKESSGGEDYFKKLAIEKPERKLLAPHFELEDLSGKRIALKGLKGKVVFLNFWATWCIPCRQEMPTMEKLHKTFKERGLEVVAVNIKEDKKDVRKFVEELGLTFTILLDKSGNISEEYGAWSIPLTYVINRKGEFIGKAAGSREWDGKTAMTFFRRLVDEKP